MGLVKGNSTLTRYRVLEEPPELTDEYIQERLARNAFTDIEATPEESSIGWVELLDPLVWNFDPASYRFGGFLAFTVRQDDRRLPGKILNRYYSIREAEFLAQTGRRPNSVKRREIKESLRLELLRRCLLNTELMEVLWLFRENEIWLAAAGEKHRLVFEELWNRTFGLSLRMLVPITMGIELLPSQLRVPLMESKGTSFWNAFEWGES